jgi:AcrR family transcriptional regulator
VAAGRKKASTPAKATSASGRKASPAARSAPGHKAKPAARSAPVAAGTDTREVDVPDEAAGIRRSIELLWGVERRPARGPKPALTIEGIVGAALVLADRDGLAALSMARIAKELGFTTMSLYRYVQSKDELLMLITDAALGPPPEMTGVDDWRAGLDRCARALRAAYQAHPWSLRVPITGPPIAPNSVAWLDAGLGALAATDLDEQSKANVFLLVSGYVRNEVSLQRDLATNEDQQLLPTPGPPPSYGDALRLVVREDQFPALHRALATDAFDDEGEYGDEEFDFGLATVLDGIAALVERRRPAKRR